MTASLMISGLVRKQRNGLGLGIPGRYETIRTAQDEFSLASPIDALTDLFILRGVPACIRSDNGPEFIAQAVRDWIVAVGAKTAYIEPESPWENRYCESFNARLRDELLNC